LTSATRLDGARCVVTGANSGIGLEIATALARDGADVALVCRSRERGEAAVAAIRAKAPSSGVASRLRRR
jgi:dehydrogenase/reductase SDR family protein 12